MATTDLLEVDQINESWYGEVFLLKFNPDHQFYWLSNQTPEEVCMMLMFDSHNGKAESNMHCKLAQIAFTRME